MLEILVPGGEYYDEINEEFIYPKNQTIRLEHSLVSLSKWESKWHEPYLHTIDKTDEQVIDYIRCMTITQNVPDEVYGRLTLNNINEINTYINDPMTATTFGEEPKGKIRGEIITAEILYYWMITLGIPFECQKWHINRLVTLIKVCIKKSEKPKKMSAAERKALNASRKKKMNTKG